MGFELRFFSLINNVECYSHLKCKVACSLGAFALCRSPRRA